MQPHRSTDPLELVRLKADLAEIESQLKLLSADRTLSAGKRLIRESYLQHLRRKALLRIRIFHQHENIERCKQYYEYIQSPLNQAVVATIQRKKEEHAAWARGIGDALSSGSGTSRPFAPKPKHTVIHPDPVDTAKQTLDKARAEYARMQRELDDLSSHDAEFKKLSKSTLTTTSQSQAKGPSWAAPIKPKKELITTAKKRGRTPDRLKLQRWEIICQIYKRQPELEGKAFWTVVQNEGGHPDYAWMSRKKNPCPKKLSEAFDDPEWKKALILDKTRATKKLRN